jgi:hypothetical protein
MLAFNGEIGGPKTMCQQTKYDELVEPRQTKECECLPKCPFFNDVMVDMPISAKLMKVMYCHEDNTRCARYIVYKALGKGSVPPNLFPDQEEIALDLVMAARVDT